MKEKFLKVEKKKIIISGIFSMLFSFIGVVFPILSARLLLNLSEELYEQLIGTALFIFAVEIVRNLLFFLLKKITDFYLIDVVTNVQIKMIEETLKIEIKEIDKNTSGLFIDRVNNDTKNIVNIFSSISNILLDFLSNLGIVVVILMINPYMFIYFAITSILINIINKKRRDRFYKYQKKIREINERGRGLFLN